MAQSSKKGFAPLAKKRLRGAIIQKRICTTRQKKAPWRNWIAHWISAPAVIGLNPIGVTKGTPTCKSRGFSFYSVFKIYFEKGWRMKNRELRERFGVLCLSGTNAARIFNPIGVTKTKQKREWERERHSRFCFTSFSFRFSLFISGFLMDSLKYSPSLRQHFSFLSCITRLTLI